MDTSKLHCHHQHITIRVTIHEKAHHIIANPLLSRLLSPYLILLHCTVTIPHHTSLYLPLGHHASSYFTIQAIYLIYSLYGCSSPYCHHSHHTSDCLCLLHHLTPYSQSNSLFFTIRSLFFIILSPFSHHKSLYLPLAHHTSSYFTIQSIYHTIVTVTIFHRSQHTATMSLYLPLAHHTSSYLPLQSLYLHHSPLHGHYSSPYIHHTVTIHFFSTPHTTVTILHYPSSYFAFYHLTVTIPHYLSSKFTTVTIESPYFTIHLYIALQSLNLTIYYSFSVCSHHTSL